MGQGASSIPHDRDRGVSAPRPPNAAESSSKPHRMVAPNPRKVPGNIGPPVVFGSPMISPLPSHSSHQEWINLQRQKPTPVPTVFRWAYGGHNVYITGTFNGWKERIPLNKSNEEFATIIDLPPGTHQYKYIVDDEWRCNPDQPTAGDRSGAQNNVVEVAASDAFDFENFISTCASVSPPGDYDCHIPKMDHQTKPPPTLPPHLMQVLLNADPIADEDPSLLPVPNHVMLNHLYALSINDGVMVLGVTIRCESKYVTMVLYRPVFDDD